jgi:hypothetical protein
MIIHSIGEQLYIKYFPTFRSMSDSNDMIVVGSVDEIPHGKMKHVVVKGKTYDQQTYETRVEGDLIKIKV